MLITLSLPFIISQILVIFSMVFDFLSFQFKSRKTTFLLFIISAILICIHYFLLNKITTWIIMIILIFRFITCYFTTDKKFMFLFFILNTFALIFSYTEIYDLIYYSWSTISLIWQFQENNKLMRKMMMIGTPFVIVYNFLIFTPMGVVLEILFLMSNFIWYYRIYTKYNKITTQNTINSK